MKMDGLEVVEVNYDSPELPEGVRKLHPVLYKDGGSFCCLLGPDPTEGIFGCGATQEEAIADWERHMKNRAIDHPYGDKVAEEVIRRLGKIK